MNKSKVVENLQILGFTKSEARLYYFLIKYGPHTPLQLARKTKINRTKIYRITDKLRKKKLVEESDSKWGKTINAAQPEFLKQLIEKEIKTTKRKESILPNTLSTLEQLIKTPATTFESKYYRGTEGIKQIYWNVLSGNGDVLVFGYTDRNKLVGRRFAEKVRTEQVVRKISMYELANPQPEYTENDYTSVPGWNTYYSEKFIDEKVLTIRHQITIFNDVVSIKNFVRSDKSGIEIKNQLLADMHRQIFWHFWELAK